MTQKVLQNHILGRYISLKDSMKKLFSLFYATGLFTGYFPFAPGTIGSITGLFLVLLLNQLSWVWQLLSFFLAFIFAILATKVAIEYFQEKDPPKVVIDEILGIWITFMLFDLTWEKLFWGFLFFRFFDIVKPFPVGYIDKNIKGATGVIMDDVVAGFMAKGLLWVIFKV